MATIRQSIQTYALTTVTHERRCIFQSAQNAEILIATLFRHRDAARFELHGFVIMPDHLHVLLTPAIDQSTASCVQLIKGSASHEIRKHLRVTIWQDGYHDHRIRDAEDYANQLLYIANNPERKRYPDYPHIHTNEIYQSRLNPRPPHLSFEPTH